MSVSIPSTSISVFRSSTAQPGWTKITTFDQFMLRITNSTVTVNTTQTFSTVFTSMPIPGNVQISATVGDTTITTAQMASHFHTNSFTAILNAPTRVLNTAPTFTFINVDTTVFTAAPQTGLEGGGLSHTHPFTTQTFPTGTSSINFDLRYVDVILAQRN